MQCYGRKTHKQNWELTSKSACEKYPQTVQQEKTKRLEIYIKTLWKFQNFRFLQ